MDYTYTKGPKLIMTLNWVEAGGGGEEGEVKGKLVLNIGVNMAKNYKYKMCP